MSDLPILAQVLPLPTGVRLYSKALVFDRDLEWDEYKILWDALQDIRYTADHNIPYWMGDLLNKIEIQYGETYAQMVDLFDVESIQSLRNYKWICGRVPPEMRMEISPRGDIPFTFAKIAAPIPDPEDRKNAIKAAIEEGLTTREFQERVPNVRARIKDGRTVKEEMEEILSATFEAIARKDWETAAGLVDKAIIMLKRL